jgi:hypothetical protein
MTNLRPARTCENCKYGYSYGDKVDRWGYLTVKCNKDKKKICKQEIYECEYLMYICDDYIAKEDK